MEEIFALKVHPKDNTATVFAAPGKGCRVRVRDSAGAWETLEVKDDIPYGHKIALTEILQGDAIVKYGEVIGQASCAIRAGGHVHVHNVASLRGRGDLAAGAAREAQHEI